MFGLTCPKCNSPYDVAKLEVVSGTFHASKMWLREDGFATTDAKTFDTDKEIVYCHVCERLFPLEECLCPDVMVPTPSFEPFKGRDWTELGRRFGVVIPNECDGEPLVVYLKDHLLWEEKVVAKVCREFLDALIKIDPTSNKPVWKGLAKVDDDKTFMDFFIQLLEWMWT
jgi:uncharacterized protein YbaR (Trm112 family)